MELARVTVVGAAAATLVVGTATTGCGHHSTSPWDRPPASPETSSTASSSATASSTNPGATASAPPTQPTDYSSLLIKASDIGADFSAPQPPVLLPNNERVFSPAEVSVLTDLVRAGS